jgi:Tfp pilus assembly protein PilN
MFNDRYSYEALLDQLGSNRPLRLRSGSGARVWRLRGPALGVKVCGSSLYLASVRPGWGRRWIVGTGCIPDYVQLQPQQLGERLREFLDPLRGEDPSVVVGLPRIDAVVRLCTLPRVAKKAQRAALALQAEMYTPADDEAFCWDAAMHPANGNLAASLALVARNHIERLATRFAEAGYPLSRVTLSQFSLVHMILRVRPEGRSDRMVLVDIAGLDVELAILEKGGLVYTRGFQLSAESPSAEQSLLSEIRQAFATLRWKESDAVRFIMVGSSLQPMEAALAELGQVCRIKDWLQVGELDGLDRGEYWGALALAVDGLSWRRAHRLNLLPDELRTSKRRWRYVPTYALLAANVLLLATFGLREPIQRQFLLRQYKKEIASLEKASAQAQQSLGKQGQDYQRLESLRNFQDQAHRSLDALAEVAQRLPADTWLNTFAYRQGQVDLNGVAQSAAALLPVLQASPQFKNVKFGGALTRDPSGADRFRLQLQVKSQP